jgi:enoyl-CoA hydratase/carnithine racemase
VGELVTFRRDGHIGTITLNSPETGNRLTHEMLLALDRALIAAEEDIDAKVVVIHGAGSDFCAGGDAQEPRMQAGGPGGLLALQLQNARRWEYLSNLPRPFIAVVQGRCEGTGLTLAMCCDFIICTNDAQISEPAVLHGVTPSFALWPFYTWHKRSKEVLFGRVLSGPQAVTWGLATSAVPAGELDAEVARYVDSLLLAPADALVWMKEMISASLEARGGGIMWRDSAVYHALDAAAAGA